MWQARFVVARMKVEKGTVKTICIVYSSVQACIVSVHFCAHKMRENSSHPENSANVIHSQVEPFAHSATSFSRLITIPASCFRECLAGIITYGSPQLACARSHFSSVFQFELPGLPVPKHMDDSSSRSSPPAGITMAHLALSI